jgi:hypothetical protein
MKLLYVFKERAPIFMELGAQRRTPVRGDPRPPTHRSMVESVRSSAPENRRQRLADYRAMA